MSDGVKIASIAAVAIVTVLSFVLLPQDVDIHTKLVLGLLSLTGVYGIGAGIKFVLTKLAK